MNKSDYLKSKLPWIYFPKSISNWEILSLLKENRQDTDDKNHANYLHYLIEKFILDETNKNIFLQKIKERTLSQEEYDKLIDDIFWWNILAGYDTTDSEVIVDTSEIVKKIENIKDEITKKTSLNSIYWEKEYPILTQRNFNEQKWFWFLNDGRKGIYFNISWYCISWIDQNDIKKRILSWEKIVPLYTDENTKWLSTNRRCFEKDTHEMVSKAIDTELKRKMELRKWYANTIVDDCIKIVFDQIDHSQLAPWKYKISWIDQEISFYIYAKYDQSTNQVFFVAEWWSDIKKSSKKFHILPGIICKWESGYDIDIQDIKILKKIRKDIYLYKWDPSKWYCIKLNWTEKLSGIEKIRNSEIQINNIESLIFHHPDTIFEVKSMYEVDMKLQDFPEIGKRIKYNALHMYGKILLPELQIKKDEYNQSYIDKIKEYFDIHEKEKVLGEIKKYIWDEYNLKKLLEDEKEILFSWWIKRKYTECQRYPFFYRTNQEDKSDIISVPLISEEEIQEIRDSPKMQEKKKSIIEKIENRERNDLLNIKKAQVDKYNQIKSCWCDLMLGRFALYSVSESYWETTYGKLSIGLLSDWTKPWIFDIKYGTSVMNTIEETITYRTPNMSLSRSSGFIGKVKNSIVWEWLEKLKSIKIDVDCIMPILPILNTYPQVLEKPELAIQDKDIIDMINKFDLLKDNPNIVHIFTNAKKEYEKILFVADILAKKKAEEDMYFTTHIGKEIERYEELSKKFYEICLLVNKINNNSCEYKDYSAMSSTIYQLMEAARIKRNNANIDELEKSIEQLEVIINQILVNYEKRKEKIQSFLNQWIENILVNFYTKNPMFSDFIKEYQIEVLVEPGDGDQILPYLLISYPWRRRNVEARISLDDDNPLLSLGNQIDSLSKSVNRFIEQYYMVEEGDSSEDNDTYDNNIGGDASQENWTEDVDNNDENTLEEREITDDDLKNLLAKFWGWEKSRKKK